MAQTSRRVRKIRRLKRDRSLAYRLLDIALAERNQARMIAAALEKELTKLEAPTEEINESSDHIPLP
jgi:hypothetical protein